MPLLSVAAPRDVTDGPIPSSVVLPRSRSRYLIVITPQPDFATPPDLSGLKVHFRIASIVAAMAMGWPDFARAHTTFPLVSNRTSRTTLPPILRPLPRPDG